MKKLYLLMMATTLMVSAPHMAAEDEGNYTEGVFVLNEDWYGHNNSTINFWRVADGTIDYEIVQAVNSGYSLGCTAQYGQIFANRLFIPAKQDIDPGVKVGSTTSGRFIDLNAATVQVFHQPLQYIRQNSKGKSMADGRGFVGVTPTKGYIGSSNGIAIYDMLGGQITGYVEGSENPLITGDEINTDGLGALYQNQIGSMIRTQDYVFAIYQDKGILVIDPATDTVVKTIEGCFSSMVQSKDGDIWAGMNTNTDYQTYPYGDMGMGESWVGTSLMRIDQYSLETSTVELTDGAGVPQSWYAWTAGKLTASMTDNLLFMVYEDPVDVSSWFTNHTLYCYDIDNKTSKKIYDSQDDDLNFYGGCIQCNPVDGNIYAGMYKGDNVSTNNFVYLILDKNGKKVKSFTPKKKYWFPAMFIFPDVAAAEVSPIPDITLTAEQTVKLNDYVSDADTPKDQIVKSLAAVGDESVVEAKIVRGDLVLTPKAQGATTVTVAYCSNGRDAVETTVNVTVPAGAVTSLSADGIKVGTDCGAIVVRGLSKETAVSVYNVQGACVASRTAISSVRIDGLPSGVYIVRAGNTTQKVIL